MTAKQLTKPSHWWNCKHMTSPIGVAYCKKNDDFCLKRECDEIESVGTYKRRFK